VFFVISSLIPQLELLLNNLERDIDQGASYDFPSAI
jgi:hypothetical protein